MATASHRLSAYMANMTGKTRSDARNIVIFRALFTLTPIRISFDDNQPPAMLPISETAYTTTSGGPKFFKSKP